MCLIRMFGSSHPYSTTQASIHAKSQLRLMEHIIRSSSRPGDVVADFFMGSGSTIKAALKLGRKAIGVELEEERYLQTVSEIEKQ